MNLKRYIPSFAKNSSVEDKLFEVTLLITNVVMYASMVIGFVAGYSWEMKAVFISASVIFTIFYLLYLKYTFNKHLKLSYYLTVFILLAIAWLPSGGIMGSIINVFVLVFGSGLLVLGLKDYLKFSVFTIGLVAGFIMYELMNPEAAARFDSYDFWMMDRAGWQMIMLVVFAITLYFYKLEYKKDREKLSEINDSLKKAKHKAERADMAKDQFLANLSHEIRTPLNGLLGNLDIMQNTNLDDEQQQLMKDINHSSDILHGLISDLLDVAMIQEQGILLQSCKLNLEHLIRNVIQFFIPKVALKAGNVSLLFKHDKSIPTELFGDATRIRQVLINLLNNAVRFTSEGEVTVYTKLINVEGNQSVIQVIVKDSGLYVPVELRDKIFNPYHIASNISEEGIGLGLSVCGKVIEAMKGEIKLVDSSENGSTFSFVIPLEISESIDEKGEKEKYRYIKVLLAEDQKVNQLIVLKMLRNIGIVDVELAENGQLAVEMASVQAYDFILMDLRMPIKDGIQAAEEILNLKKGNEPVIIALTANATANDRDNCYNAGMKYFLSKPISQEVLKSSFDKFIVE